MKKEMETTAQKKKKKRGKIGVSQQESKGGESKEKKTQRENGKEGEIVPDLDLRDFGPSDVSIS